MADADGTQKDPFEDRRKDRVAGIDRVLNVAELVRQADLPLLGPIALSTQKSGRTSPRNAGRRHVLAAADDVDASLVAVWNTHCQQFCSGSGPWFRRCR